MIRLFHVSDLHFGAEDEAALDWFRERTLAEQPDAVILTGDLTMAARASEFAAAAAWLRSLGRPVTVEVGNHDLPVYNPLLRFFMPYRRYRALEAMIEAPLDLPGVTIVPLKTTARLQLRFDWSKGLVTGRALRRSLALIEAAPPGDVILVTAHHPLVEGGTRMEGRTRGGRKALAALAGAGAQAVLTGHVHDPFDRPVAAAGRAIRLIGAGTLSERVRSARPSYNELRIAGGVMDVTPHFMAEAPAA